MFSSKGKEKENFAAVAQAAPVQPTKRPMRAPSAPSIISADVIVTGTLVSTGDVQIDGKVEGDVRSAGLVIGEKAFIHGDVMAEEVTVRGRVEGSVRAHKVLLASTCHVEGNILHEAFAVETGAFFEGNCRHADNPLEEDGAKKPAQVTPPPPPPSPAPAAHVAPQPRVPQGPTATYTPLKS
jgi:cytoskeletal protein CcmA (bactofilin family)